MTTSGQLEINNYQFTWKINNFSKKCKQVSDKILSPVFEIGSLSEIQWQLMLYPFGKDESTEDFLSVFLHNKTKVNRSVCFKLTLSNLNGEQIILARKHHNFTTGFAFGWAKLIKRDSLLQQKDRLVDDILNITCNIHMDMYSVEEMDIDKKILINYKSLLSNGNFSDVTINIKDRHIKVHKNILSARSKVFEAMFRHNMKESNTNTIEITDVSYDIMKEILQFIYSGKVENLEKNGKDLLVAAEKYEITELILLCEKSLWHSVKIENASEILSVADFYNRSELKAKTMDYIITNIKQINKTPKFKDLIRTSPELYQEIMTEVIDKKL